MADNTIKFDAKLDSVIRALSGAEKAAQHTGQSMGNAIGAGITGGLAGAGVMIVAKLAEIGIQGGIAIGKAVVSGLTDAVNAAGDANESLSRFDALFKENKESAEEFADTLATAIGRSSLKIKEGLATFQAFFVGLGFGGDEAERFSEKLTQAALDFASFNNLSDEEAMQKFISALGGSGEVLANYGIDIKEAALATKGITDKSTEAEKAVARLDIIMERMGAQGSLGDAIKTSGSYNNQVKSMKDLMADLQVEIGQKLLPTITELMPAIKEIIRLLGDMAEDAVEAFAGWFDTDGLTTASEKLIAIFATLEWWTKRVANDAKGMWAAITGDKQDAIDFWKMDMALGSDSGEWVDMRVRDFQNRQKIEAEQKEQAALDLDMQALLDEANKGIKPSAEEDSWAREQRLNKEAAEDEFQRPLRGGVVIPEFEADMTPRKAFASSIEDLQATFNRIQTAAASNPELVAQKSTAQNTKVLADWVQDGAPVRAPAARMVA